MRLWVHHRDGEIRATEWAVKPSDIGLACTEAEFTCADYVQPKTHRVENGEVVPRVTLTGNA